MLIVQTIFHLLLGTILYAVRIHTVKSAYHSIRFLQLMVCPTSLHERILIETMVRKWLSLDCITLNVI